MSTVTPLRVVVTGANSGLGLACTLRLVELGHEVLATVRDEKKGNEVIEKAKNVNPSAKISFMILEMSDLSSVRKFVDNFHAENRQIDILLNNAGLAVGFRDQKRVPLPSDETYEYTVTVNALAPFLLTTLLLDDLKSSAAARANDEPSRIINVSSMLTTFERQLSDPKNFIDVEDFMSTKEGSYVNGMIQYRRSKVAMNLWSNELAKSLDSSKVTINTVCPGWVPSTDLGRSMGVMGALFMKFVGSFVGRKLFKSVTMDEGRDCILDLVLNEAGKQNSGKFFQRKSPVQEAPDVLDEDNRKKIWAVCEKYANVQ